MYPTEFDGTILGGFYIHEPGALMSNIAIAITCLVLVVRCRNVSSRAARYWVLFIACIGIAATGGMISHGFPTYISEKEFFSVWWIKNVFVLLGNYFAGRAVLMLTNFSQKKAGIFLLIKFLFGAVLLYSTYVFLPAVIDLAITYIAILVITWNRTEDPSAAYLKKSFLIALLSGLFYLFPFKLMDGWFTNKDAVHVFAIISLAIVSQAVREMESA